MSFSKVNGPGWAFGSKLTSAQMNLLDADHANSLDKSAAGDSVLGAITFANGSSVKFNAGAPATFGDKLSLHTHTVTTSISIDSLAAADLFLAIANSSAITIQLPNPANNSGRVIIAQDINGAVSPTSPGAGFNVAFLQFGSERIGGLAAAYSMETAWGGIMLVCDGTNWLLSTLPKVTSVTFTATASWTCPAGITDVSLDGWGGGGGGASGLSGSTGGTAVAGGGGGGGSLRCIVPSLTVVPGTVYTANIGGGGSGGGGNGSPGTNTRFTAITNLAVFLGASGGSNSLGTGGMPFNLPGNTFAPASAAYESVGGCSTTATGALNGGPSRYAGSGGSGGLTGTTVTNAGGLGGGGGGAGPAGGGGGGGAGGNGVASGVGAAGSVGGAAAANSGGGGGGGGAGGNGSSGGSSAGGGGNGGSGQLTISWVS